MNLTLFMFVFCSLQISASITWSQNKLNIEVQNSKIADVLSQIENQSSFKFAYSSQFVDMQRKVSINMKQAELEDVLTQLFKDTKIDFKIEKDFVILVPKIVKPSKSDVSSAEEEKKITGQVLDKQGFPIPGVSVHIKGGTLGTITDFEGNFLIQNVSEDAFIVFSFIGMKTQELPVGNKSVFKVVLEDELVDIEEVVVVGYGSQKKINLTGSVAVVDAEVINSRPITSVTQGLQGLLPGVTITNPTGAPGSSESQIRIRGIGTIGNANPLVLIDGVEGNINQINPDDIESVSVLKDAASASIYGARAANGVILITTKQLMDKEQDPTINFSSYYGVQTPTCLPEMANAIDFMNWDNEARRNIGQAEAWVQEHFDNVNDGSNPNFFANTNWVDQVFRKSAPQQNYTVNVTGKTALTGYLFSYSFLNQEGLTANNTTNEKRHNLRLKLNARVADFFTVTSNISYMSRNNESPLGNPLYNAMRIAPNAPVLYTDGTWAYGGGNVNPLARLIDGGQRSIDADRLSAIFTGKLDFTKNWNATATYNVTRDNALNETLLKTLVFINPETLQENIANSPNSLTNQDIRGLQQSLILQSNFEVKIDEKQSISGVGGFSQEWYVTRNFLGSRNNLLTEKDPTLNLGDQEGMSNNAGASQWAIRSGFGRLNYNYMDKYLLEANLRYDLTSKFIKENRGGLFPSFSAAWRLTQEDFMSFASEVFDNIKLRGSWGVLGNQYVGSNNYPYMAIIGNVTTPNIGTMATTGYTQTTLPNPDLTWETIYMTNLGVDMTLLNNKLNVTFDYFIKDTEGILLRLTYPDQLGLPPTEENVGAVNNKGWELGASWNDKIGDFSYSVNFNLSDVKNQITDLGGLAPSYGDYSIRRVGDPIDAFYGYEAIGLMTPEDFKYDEYLDEYYSPQIPVIIGDNNQPGDIKYRDISGPNGEPDGRITPEYDRKVIGSSIPRFTYMFRADLAWKNLDCNFTIQGVGKANGYLQGSARHAFQDMAGYPQKIHGDRYNLKSNPNPNAAYPRFTYNTDFNQRFSTFWLEDASYLRLKNIQVGYSLSKELLSKLKIDRCRFYASADNLITLSDFFYAYDPETPVTKGGYYPQVKTFVIGVNLTLK
uniref:TonB-dependent receptor n=1 Tax=uncultured Draconibacterium sp. TaxID=1573823 RepID=UPI0032172387